MAKVTKSITFDLDDLNVLIDLKGKYKLKNVDQALHKLMGQWADLRELVAKMREMKEDHEKKPVNPMVNP